MKKSQISHGRKLEAEPDLEHVPRLLDELEKNVYRVSQQIDAKRSKRKVLVESEEGFDEDRLTVLSPTGEVELSIRMTVDGPVLLFSGAEIQLCASKKIEISSDEISLVANKALKTESRGDRADITEGRASTKARSIDLQAALGNVTVSANDDVRLNGERIFLNK